MTARGRELWLIIPYSHLTKSTPLNVYTEIWCSVSYIVTHTVGMYVLVYTQYSLVYAHCLHRHALIDTKQEATSYRSSHHVAV